MNIVMIGLEEFIEMNDYGERTRMIYKALIKNNDINRVIIIHSPLSIQRRIKNFFSGQKRFKDLFPTIKKTLFTTLVQASEKLIMCDLTTLTPESKCMFSIYNRKMLSHKINNLLKYLKIDNYILWISNPRIVDIAKYLNANFIVFDAIDNLLEHPDMNKYYKQIKKSYEWIDGNANLIYIASKNQTDMFVKNTNIFILPNGVDDIFFNENEYLKPREFDLFNGPIIGYVGVLQRRFDVDLMIKVATILPDYNFILIGPILDSKYFSELMKLKNVHFLGPKKYKDIPQYMAHFNVSIIPHKNNNFTKSMDPLKIYEYLACGSPIVSTPINGTERFKDLIETATTPDEFSDSIKKLNSTNSPELIKLRKNVSINNSWGKIVKETIATLYDEINF